MKGVIMSLLNFGVRFMYAVQNALATAEMKLCLLCSKMPWYEVVTVNADSIEEFDKEISNYRESATGGFTLDDKIGDERRIIKFFKNDRRIFMNK